jgi:hypothetical protein
MQLWRRPISLMGGDMKLSVRLVTFAVTAVALAGALGAQQRTNGQAGGRSQPRASGQAARPQPRASGQSYARSQQPRMSGQSFARSQPPRTSGQSFARSQPPRTSGQSFARSQPPRGQVDNRARQDVRVQQYARAGIDARGGNAYGPRNDPRAGTGYRVPVAEHGRPLITRGYAPGREYGRPVAYGGSRFGGDREFRGGREFRDGGWFYGGRAFPFGWESRVVFGGYFPGAYAGYCDAVPYDYDYMLPPMMPSYDPCLFGDRVIVFDRFSRHIVFVATL